MAQEIGDLLTLVVAFDGEHLPELRAAWATWEYNRPELMKVPVVAVMDHELAATEGWRRGTDFLTGRPHVTLRDTRSLRHIADRRERMLTSFVLVAPQLVATPWHLKLDSDCLAVDGARPLYDPFWFAPVPGSGGAHNAFVASPWPYTKPADAIARLDRWAAGYSSFSGTDPLDLPYEPGSARVRHQRMTSWCFFGNTEWVNRAAAYARNGMRLPVPSHDTYLWYVAARLDSHWRQERMAKRGWAHVPGPANVRRQAAWLTGMPASTFS